MLSLYLLISAFPAVSCDVTKAKKLLSSFEWQTEDYPPYNYINANGELEGIFTDILLAVFQKLNLEINKNQIELVPWARLYNNLKTKNRYAAFSMTYTDERAKEFRIITTPLSTKISVMVLAQNYEQLKALPLADLVLGVVREDIGHHLVNRSKLPSTLVPTTSASSMLKMLISGRVNAIAYAEEVAQFQLENLLLNDKKIVPLRVLENDASHGFVFHKNTPDCVVQLFHSTIIELDKNEELVRIRDRYIDQSADDK